MEEFDTCDMWHVTHDTSNVHLQSTVHAYPSSLHSVCYLGTKKSPALIVSKDIQVTNVINISNFESELSDCGQLICLTCCKAPLTSVFHASKSVDIPDVW